MIKRFEDYRFSGGLSKARITKYVLTLRKIAEWLKKDFDEAGGRILNDLLEGWSGAITFHG